jgi:hypothetical protein
MTLRFKMNIIIRIFVLSFIIVSTTFAQNNSVFEKKPIQILDAIAGVEPGEFGIMIPDAGQAFPQDFIVDINMDIWIMDCINKRVQKFNQNGKFILQFPNDKNPCPVKLNCVHIKCDQKGNIIVGPNSEGYMVVIDNNGQYINSFKLPDVSREQIDFAIDQQDKIIYTKNNTNISMDLTGTILNKIKTTEVIVGSHTSPYSPYRPSAIKDPTSKSLTWQINNNNINSNKINDHTLKKDNMTTLGAPGFEKVPLKVDANQNYFIRNPISNLKEIISYNDEEGNLIAALQQTTSDSIDNEFYPYVCYTIDKKGNFYRLEIAYPPDASINAKNQFYGGSTFLKLWKWER